MTRIRKFKPVGKPYYIANSSERGKQEYNPPSVRLLRDLENPARRDYRKRFINSCLLFIIMCAEAIERTPSHCKIVGVHEFNPQIRVETTGEEYVILN